MTQPKSCPSWIHDLNIKNGIAKLLPENRRPWQKTLRIRKKKKK